MVEKSDNEIVKDYLSGDAASFDLLVKRHIKAVYNFTLRLSGSSGEANDITQEVFVKVWKNIKKFKTDKNFKTWILTIARNTTIDWLRKKRGIAFSRMNPQKEENDISFEETLVDLEPLPDEIFMKKELDKEVEDGLLKIRPEYREIILLHHSAGLIFEEIGKAVGKPLNTVKSQYRRGLNSLRKLLLK